MTTSDARHTEPSPLRSLADVTMPAISRRSANVGGPWDHASASTGTSASSIHTHTEVSGKTEVTFVERGAGWRFLPFLGRSETVEETVENWKAAQTASN